MLSRAAMYLKEGKMSVWNRFELCDQGLDTSNFYHCLPLKIVENGRSALALNEMQENIEIQGMKFLNIFYFEKFEITLLRQGEDTSTLQHLSSNFYNWKFEVS